MMRRALPHRITFAAPALAARASFLFAPESLKALLYWRLDGGQVT